MTTPAKAQVDTTQNTDYAPRIAQSSEIERPYAEDGNTETKNASDLSRPAKDPLEAKKQERSSPDVTVTVQQ